MVSPTNNLSALSEQIIDRFKLVAAHPETDALDYAGYTHMDPAKICADIKLTHSKDLHWYITKVHTYKNPQVRVLALTIAEYFNPEKGYSYPPQSLLSALLGINRQTVSKLTKELEATGYWTITRGAADVSTRYTLPPVEFSRLRDFLVAERTPKTSYLNGATFPRVMVNEARSRANLIPKVKAVKAEAAETQGDPFDAVPVPYWGRSEADEHALSLESEATVATEPEPMEPDMADIADIEQSETIPAQDATESTPEAEHAPAAKWINRSVTDEQTAIIVSSTVDAGLCLDETGARSSVRDAISKESDRDPSLSPEQLKDIAHGNLSAGILSGKWTRHNPARINELLAVAATTVQEVGERMEDPFALPDDLN